MPDTIVAKDSDAKFTPHPDGQYVAQCVDTVDLGDRIEEFGGHLKPSHKCVIVFRTGEVNQDTGELLDISREFTVSMSGKSNLRKFLEMWRGKAYTNEEAAAGVPIEKLVGKHALLTIEHRQSAKGRTYASIAAAVGVPKQMKGKVPDYLTDYERNEFWVERKEEYAKAAAAYRTANTPAANNNGANGNGAKQKPVGSETSGELARRVGKAPAAEGVNPKDGLPGDDDELPF